MTDDFHNDNEKAAFGVAITSPVPTHLSIAVPVVRLKKIKMKHLHLDNHFLCSTHHNNNVHNFLKDNH
ncbi:hypothetical protein E2C01_008301 [Portunus trituberculatus]|uniref:Uncharacterized protein n=1 Tax=Portunus trituberculatus TaxID=210409 RepID=A0A5B7D1E9_PORTR|nr:hypothetical protein [Portunus trituberculatus]